MSRKKSNKSIKKSKVAYVALVIVFAVFSVLGLQLITHNKQKGIESADASTAEPADLNNDGIVDIFDLSMLLSKWNTADSLSDLNKDGTVNIFDLSILLTRWGTIVTVSPRTISPGAKLPISYDINSLTGNKRYVATTGNDTTGTGSISAPYATIKKAESVAVDGDTIVVRGGTYAMSANATTVDRANLTIIAYPGETPTFDGSISAPTTAATEGSLKYFSYQPMPAGTGEGVVLANLPSATFSGTTPTGQAAERGWRCVTGSTTYTIPVAGTTTDPDGCGSNSAKVITGYFPDQVWVNGVALRQVLDKSRVGPGEFWVDRNSTSDAAPAVTNLYLYGTDAADMTKVKVSSAKSNFLLVSAANVRLAGLRFINNSPMWSQGTVLLNNNNAKLENIYLDSNASGALKIARGNTLTNLATGNTLKNVTVTRSGWTGAVLYYNDDTTLDSVLFTNNEAEKEFLDAPQRGAIKATKSDRTRILNSAFENNTIGVWFDQSNYKTDIVGSRFVNNSDSAVFYEISHGLTLANNLMIGNSGGSTLRLAGASALKIVNNTMVGGKDVIWVGTDARSKKFTVASTGQVRDCSEHTLRYGQGGDASADCWVGYSSDFDVARPGAYSPTGATNLTPGMDWNNWFTVFVNNIVADASVSGNCGSIVPFCMNGYINWNSSQGLIHQQVDLNKTFSKNMIMNGNLYQSTSGKIVMIRADSSVSQPGGFTATDLSYLKGTSGFGSSYYGLSVEANGLYASSGLVDAQGVASGTVNHSNAAPVPTDTDINKYINSGYRHYGIQ